jgi:hypothetical protein
MKQEGDETHVDHKRRQDDALDDALAQTFPASDPVAQQIFN